MYNIVLPPSYIIDYDDTNGIDLDQAAADVAVFNVPFQCVLEYPALLISETCAGTTPGVVKMDKRPTAGSDTSRGDGDIAVFNMGTTAAGKMLYDLVAQGTVLVPGDQIVVQITTQPVTGPAGHFHPIVVVRFNPETIANMADMVATA